MTTGLTEQTTNRTVHRPRMQEEGALPLRNRVDQRQDLDLLRLEVEAAQGGHILRMDLGHVRKILNKVRVLSGFTIN